MISPEDIAAAERLVRPHLRRTPAIGVDAAKIDAIRLGRDRIWRLQPRRPRRAV